MRDFGELLRRSASDHASRIAMSCEGFTQTYTELFDRACRLSNALTALGLVKGDRVAILGANSRWTIEHAAGVALGGFVRAGLYAHQTPEVNAYLTDLVDARVLVVDAALAPGLVGARASMPKLEQIIVYGGEAPAGTLAYEPLLEKAASTDPHVVTAPTDLHVIRFSAGTTGRPKGIVHTVEGWQRSNDEYRWVTPMIDERDVYLAVGQLTHAASVFMWPFLQVGAKIVVVPAFEPGKALALIESERVTFTLVVPTMIQAIVAHADAGKRNLKTLRCVHYAASPISETTLLKAVDLFGEHVLFQMYAQSEAWPITMLLPHQHRDRARSVGRATPGNVITVVDDDGKPVPIGEIGEIAVRGCAQMLEIWKDPEATKARTLPDGSRLTRDIGRVDAEGFVYLADRKEDMIISGGFNIWPAELENAIASHPSVAEVCVVGIPHEKWGETPLAVIVPAPGATIDVDAIIALTREKVGAVQRVTRVEIATSLPKSGVGKVLRREVRDPYWVGKGDRLGRV